MPGSKLDRIVILGAGGFIGSHLVKSLLESSEAELLCFDLTEEKLNKIVPDGGFKFQTCHIRENRDLVDSAIAESDLVIDLVAHANPSIYMRKPMEVVELNLFDNLIIVDSCEKHGKPLLQFSSCEVYGKTGGKIEPFNEDTTDLILGPIGNHRWIYSCAKQMLERILHAKYLDSVLDYVIIRPFNFIGPEMDYLIKSQDEGQPRVFPQFMSALLFNIPMILVDGGQNYRTFTDIEDAVDGIALVINNFDKMKNQIVNVGTPDNETSIIDLAYLMKELYEEIKGEKSSSEVIELAGDEFYGQGYEDCDRRIPDVGKLTKLGWKPKYNLRETFKRAMIYYIDLFEKGQLQ